MERVQPGETFDVPRTALLLTGAVKSLLPLPASFSMAVQNPKRTTSAADLLWPSNITSSWDGSSESTLHTSDSGGLGPPAGRCSDGVVGSMTRQQSAPGGYLPQHGSMDTAQQEQQRQRQEQIELAKQPSRTGQGNSSCGSLSSVDSATASKSGTHATLAAGHTAAAATGNVSVSVRDVTGPSQTAAAAAGGKQAAGAGVNGGDPLKLVAPVELPPGDFICITEAMVLQVIVGGCCGAAA